MYYSLSVYYHNGNFELQFNSDGFYHWLTRKTKSGRGHANLIKIARTAATVRFPLLSDVAKVATSFFHKINVSTLPNTYRSLFDKPVSTHNSGENPYQTLFLDSKAPMEVVKAAYKALSRLHHPDTGGDADKFRTITDAYRRIREDNRGST